VSNHGTGLDDLTIAVDGLVLDVTGQQTIKDLRDKLATDDAGLFDDEIAGDGAVVEGRSAEVTGPDVLG